MSNRYWNGWRTESGAEFPLKSSPVLLVRLWGGVGSEDALRMLLGGMVSSRTAQRGKGHLGTAGSSLNCSGRLNVLLGEGTAVGPESCLEYFMGRNLLLPREAVNCPSLEVFKDKFTRVWNDLVWWKVPARGRNERTFKVQPNPNSSGILGTHLGKVGC